MNHFKIICDECGKTIAQCRCMCCDKVIKHQICDECLQRPNSSKEVVKAVVDCEGLVEKKEEKGEHPERSPSYFWNTKGYNSALDLFSVLMAKKCLECREERTGQKPYDPERVKFLAGESKGDKT